MSDTAYRAIAIVGAGAVLPDAADAQSFWENVKSGRYSITDVSADRWDPARYYDADPGAPDKTYSKIGGWVRKFLWDPFSWRLPIPPRVSDAMDDAQKWAVACTRQALDDYGYPGRPLNTDRTAVILGSAMAGEHHYLTALRLYFPEFSHELEEVSEFAALPESVRRDITRKVQKRFQSHLPEITEDTMPGELANCMAGRIANLFNLHGPNYVADAACASAMAAISASVEGLVQQDYDVAITGGIDRNMGASTYIKFCKIGALSATGTRPYAEGADGFVMGEGAAIFLLKRLADAERDGDRIYAVLRGMAGSSDGRGKGITAPNPIGQKLCVERAWQNAGLSPATVTYVEGHGTSTRVGDVVETQSLADVLKEHHLPARTVALGSVKSNIGHLKGAAGAAGLLKTVFALHDRVLPPSLHCEHPNPDIDFAHSPVFVNTELQPWTATADGVRRAGVSAFGFGGTNFHAVLEEYIPHRLTTNGKHAVSMTTPSMPPPPALKTGEPRSEALKTPLRGALVVGAANADALARRLQGIQAQAAAGQAPAPAPPSLTDLRAAERIAIDYSDAADLADKSGKALKALAADQPAIWKALRAQGIFRGHGPAPKVAFLYTGQGSQYVNMLQTLRAAEPIVAETFAEADRIMAPLLGKPLSSYIFLDGSDSAAVARAENDLKQTAITQPAVLATDLALTRLLAAYGIRPDMTMGHSLGEYGALVASGGLAFAEALEAVSARGREMTRISIADNGRMAAIFAPIPEIERILAGIDGYIVIANINSNTQAVIGGASRAVEEATEAFLQAGYNAVPLEVSHAFHTSIVAPASEPLRSTLTRLHLTAPAIPVVANVNGEFYPAGPDAPARMVDILARQVASPVQFVKGLRTLYDAGVRAFVEVGPKKALQGFAEDVIGDHGDVITLFTNHPKVGDLAAFNQALCGLYAAGLGAGAPAGETDIQKATTAAEPGQALSAPVTTPERMAPVTTEPATADRYAAMGHLLADFLDRSWSLWQGKADAPRTAPPRVAVTISGAALGLPGADHLFDDANIARILRGEQFIGAIPPRLRQAILDKNITRLVKTDNGGPVFEAIRDPADVIKLAGRAGAFDLRAEFGISQERLAALDRVTQMAIAVGIDAMRDAGIPLVMHYKTTTRGTQLPDRWGLPDSMRDDTGIIFASCWPGADSLIEQLRRYYADRFHREQISLLEDLRRRVDGGIGAELDSRIAALRQAVEADPYLFDRRFLFRVLSMGHSQFAEFIGARGPNTQINAACASTTQAVCLAQDWIREGRCRRVIVVAADDVTSDNMMEWIGAGFLATGAAATDEAVEEAALPFDRRRHGMILGMGAAGLVVETAEAVAERGMRPVCEVLSASIANSAFHGTRLDVQHICQIMESLVARAEERSGIPRHQMAQNMVFLSHETYTPARGGSASAEIHALRSVFGADADRIVIANTKGFTGHAMGAGIEDVVAVKALETGCVPPVANFREVDPELGMLNLSKGGEYPVEFALRLGAGFGSQISMTLFRRSDGQAARRSRPDASGYQDRVSDQQMWRSWLQQVSGDTNATVEIVQRTLRVRDSRTPATVAEPVQAPAPEPVATPPGRETRPAAPAATATADPVRERVLTLVAAKTGYPVDMLALDLDLEADLGVDTVKQAEVFASVREAWNIPRDETLRLRDFPTLAHVIQFVYAKRPDLVTSAAAAPAVKAPGDDSVKERVLALVAAKTGYPVEMLDLDLDLEADLGVDTVKQAEVFASVREAWNIPRDETLRLRDFPTLAHVIQFVYAKRPDLATTAAAAPVTSAAAAPAVKTSGDDSVKERVLALVCEKTGYPSDMLDLDLDLEADLGVDTVKQAELFAAIRERYNIPRDEHLKLRDFPTLKHVIRFVHDRRPDLAPATKPVSAPPPTPDEDRFTAKVLEIVAQQTGYPKEMLDLDLDLEADLGIDTVKQAETFAAVRAAFGIPRDERLKLRDFPTLKHVIGFARERHVETAPAHEQPAPAPASPVASAQVSRRIPVPMLRPPLSLCKATGVALGPGSRVLIAPDQGGVANALQASLASLGVEVIRLDESANPEEAVAQAVQGVYWLPALDDEGPLSDMSIETWREATALRVKRLYSTMRKLYEQVSAAGTFLISAVRLGGQHGYNAEGATAPLGGAVTGFTKAYKRERPSALVKAIDFEMRCDPASVARRLMAETLQDPGAVEIGYRNDLRWTVGLQERTAQDGEQGMTLDHKSVFVVTGAAGSIVSAITADLARASGGTFYLMDLTPEPDPQDPDLQRFDTDRDGLKRDLAGRMQARGERPTPALIERQLAGLERSKAALYAMEAVRAAGGTAVWLSVDLNDAGAVADAVASVRERSGRIDVLLHAAGLERSHILPDKEAREFDLVFDVKANGWFNLLNAVGDMPLGATVAFSSIAGRFGNGGQTDYSAANDLLCKLTSAFRTTRPGTRGIAIDWTAWGGIGMASRGSIPKMMEAAGIDMLAPEVGIPFIRQELTGSASRGEVVVAERLGLLLNEFDESGGVRPAEPPIPGIMTGHIASVTLNEGLRIETTLDPRSQPFLDDHRIDGTPVLPGVMSIEAVVEAAACLLPGWNLASVEDVEFLAPLKFYRDEPRTLVITAREWAVGADEIVADCALASSRKLAGQTEPQQTIHLTARARMRKRPPAEVGASAPPSTGELVTDSGGIYQVYFHGPSFRVVDRIWRAGEQVIGVMASNLPDCHRPSDQMLLASPRYIELCFQTAGIEEILRTGRMGLPSHIGRIEFFHFPETPGNAVYALISRSESERDGFDAEVVVSAGNVLLRMQGYRTMALPDIPNTAALHSFSAVTS